MLQAGLMFREKWEGSGNQSKKFSKDIDISIGIMQYDN